MTGRIPVTVLVMAKAPVPGEVKTRLCPPLLPEQAADLAAAALLDTLDAVAGATRTWTVALAGRLPKAARSAELTRAVHPGRVIGQHGNGFAARLVAAHADAGAQGPVLQIGMDTPQLSSLQLLAAMRALTAPGVDAVLGPAADGGWWALGVRSPDQARVLADIPMSRPDTGRRTLDALRGNGCTVELLPTLTDVDTYGDAVWVAAEAPSTRFAAAVRSISAGRLHRVAS